MKKFRSRGSIITGLLATAAIGMLTAAPAHASDNATAGAQAAPTAAASRISKVTVPSNYVYNPRKGSLHDYCTSSPDSYLSADFRGPCARHDLCYAKPGNHKKACDATLDVQLSQNCAYAYGSLNPLRYSCINTAHGYWMSVTSFGDDH